MKEKELKEVNNICQFYDAIELKDKLGKNGITLDFALSRLKELMSSEVNDISLRATIKALELLTKKDKGKMEVENINLYYLQKMKEEDNE